MRRRPRFALALLLAACVGCGEESSVSDDDPAAIVDCLEEEGLAARRVAGDEIRVGRFPGAPRVLVLPNTGAAEARALAGRAEGAEQIGPALLYVGRGTEAQLARIERCLEGL